MIFVNTPTHALENKCLHENKLLNWWYSVNAVRLCWLIVFQVHTLTSFLSTCLSTIEIIVLKYLIIIVVVYISLQFCFYSSVFWSKALYSFTKAWALRNVISPDKLTPLLLCNDLLIPSKCLCSKIYFMLLIYSITHFIFFWLLTYYFSTFYFYFLYLCI